MAFPLTAEQRKIVDDRGGELLVSAAAGSGKTRVLVERLLDRVTGEGLDIDRFLVITYTKAAAAELRERIAQELTARLAERPTDRHLRRQNTLVYQAQISTIHSFCSALIRENVHLLDLDPDFRLCDEAEGDILMAQTLDNLIEEHYAALEEGSPFAQLVDTLGAGRDDSKLTAIVLDIFRRVQSHADPEGWLEEQKEHWKLEGIGDLAQTPWGELLLEDARNQARRCRELLLTCQEDLDADATLQLNYHNSIAQTLAALEELSGAENWDEAAACFPISFPKAGNKRRPKGEPEDEAQEGQRRTQRVKALRDRCKKTMDKVGETIEGDSQILLEELRLSSAPMQALVDLVLEFREGYAAEKRRRSLVDFSDLEHFAVRLLRSPDGQPTELARAWSLRYDEILVDEYQDTNQVQNAIFQAISDGGRKLVQVGDVKQSIYRFRLADPTIFLDKYQRFAPGDEGEEGQPRVRVLSKNFRSRPQVLEGCNDLFRAIMSQRFGELDYTDDQALVPGAAFPEGKDYALEVDILDLEDQRPDGEIRVSKSLMEARFTARRIRQLLTKPLMIRDGDGLRPVRPSDIMVLLRSPGSVLGHYARAFGEAGIPWSAEGGEDWMETTQVRVALSILRIVDNPRQDVPLIAALRSPVYGFSADKLALLRAECAGDFYDAVCQAAARGDEACAAFLEQLSRLRLGAGEMTCSQIIWHVYEQTNLLGIFGAMERGEQRQEDLLSLYDLARRMEDSGCRSLFQFLLRLDRLAQTGNQKPHAKGSGTGEGVTLLSIHRSKGLEKPVVLVCGLTKLFNRDDLARPVLFHPKLGIGPKGLDVERRVEYSTVARRAVARQLEREMLSEELRLLYVAMTRAQEKLILSLALPEARKTMEKLTDLLSETLAPELLEQQPSVGHWVLLHALSRAEAGRCDEIRALGPDRLSVAYGPAWDIRYLSASTVLGRERSRSTVTGVAKSGETEDLTVQRELLTWRYPAPEGANIPSKLTATQIKGRTLDLEIGQDAPAEEHREERPIYRPDFVTEERGLTPAQRGTALHLVMEHLDLSGDLSESGIRAQMEEMVDRELLTRQQKAVIPVNQIAAFYKSDVGQRLTRAKTCQREFKFSILTDASDYYPGVEGEQLLLQGVVDAWFEDEEGVTVLDFKSDRIQPGEELLRAEQYRPQLTAYGKALKRILGKEKLTMVLWFFKTGRAVELSEEMPIEKSDEVSYNEG